MDGIEDDDSRYSRKSYPLNFSNPRKLRTRDNIPYAGPIPTRYEEKDDEDEELDELDEEMDRQDDEEFVDFERHPKKRKVKNFVPSFEFAPRAKSSYGVRSLGVEKDWTERAVFVLLEVWGNMFVQLGRRSLRFEDWQEVSEKVAEVSKISRTEMQCRNMLDSLKRKYKKEKARMDELGLKSSKWAYFKKMDILMASPARQNHGLACGVDSGEFVFANTRVYLDRSNRFDEMRDSPVESENSDEEDDNGNDSDGLPPRRVRSGGGGNGESSSSFRVLADSIQKFGEIYGKIESNKRQQMMELENMRRDFYRELELQKKQILERTQAEIAKIQENDDEDEDGVDDSDDSGDSAEDLSE
ncbi:hypothetical protein L484_020829 [Morus notabilis]|uniref:Myb/SANT-like DNA-binding domain-containing protein n=1 Tax=Morus notabilis TaxID=981085 RepID=W9R2K4_9ROSA|nr:trihelix transcription factor ASIL1 [Morus notabilis]EXB37042.1 hypothetical protein L484_020829 [Morus notabilis]